MKKYLLFGLIAVLGLMTACSDDDDKKAEYTETVKNVLLTPTELEMYIGDEAEIELAIFPETALINMEAVWTSEDESIATVNEEGKITAVSKGETKIKFEDMTSHKTAEVSVTVLGEAFILDEALKGAWYIDSYSYDDGNGVTMTQEQNEAYIRRTQPANADRLIAFYKEQFSFVVSTKNRKVFLVYFDNSNLRGKYKPILGEFKEKIEGKEDTYLVKFDASSVQETKVKESIENLKVVFNAEKLETKIGDWKIICKQKQEIENIEDFVFEQNKINVAVNDEVDILYEIFPTFFTNTDVQCIANDPTGLEVSLEEIEPTNDYNKIKVRGLKAGEYTITLKQGEVTKSMSVKVTQGQFEMPAKLVGVWEPVKVEMLFNNGTVYDEAMIREKMMPTLEEQIQTNMIESWKKTTTYVTKEDKTIIWKVNTELYGTCEVEGEVCIETDDRYYVDFDIEDVDFIKKDILEKTHYHEIVIKGDEVVVYTFYDKQRKLGIYYNIVNEE